MQPEEIQSVIRRARSLARSRGHDAIADDFAQEAAVSLWQGRKASLEQLLIDYLRSEYGRSGSSRLRARHRTVSLDDDYTRDGEGLALHEIIADPKTLEPGDAPPGGGPGVVFDAWGRELDAIRGTGWIIERLYYGDTQEQIALELGVSQSRISQIVKTEKEKARRDFILMTELPEYRADPERSLVLVRWIGW